MRRFGVWSVVIAVALLASPLWAQESHQQGGRTGGRMGGEMSPIMLLGQKSVQEELKLTEDQMSKVDSASKEMREKMQGMRDMPREERQEKMKEMRQEGEKMAHEILKPEQAKRLHEIWLQQMGARAFADPKVAEELNITSDQKEKLHAIQQDTMKEMADMRESGSMDREKMMELHKNATEKAMAVLTDEQKTKWKEMTGEPFHGEIHMMQRGERGQHEERGGGR